MLCLNIRQQPAVFEFSTTRAFLEVNAAPAQIRIDTVAAKVEIRQQSGKLEIDNTPFRASYGIKNFTDFAFDNAELGKQAVLEAIARISQEGDRLARIESGENVVAEMAFESNSPLPPDITVASLQLPTVRYQASPVEFNPIPGKVDLIFLPGKIEGDYQPGKVTGRMKQYQSIRFWTTENKYDIYA